MERIPRWIILYSSLVIFMIGIFWSAIPSQEANGQRIPSEYLNPSNSSINAQLEQTNPTPQPQTTQSTAPDDPIQLTIQAYATLQFAPSISITPPTSTPPSLQTSAPLTNPGQITCQVSATGGWDSTAPLNYDVQVKKNGQPLFTRVRLMVGGELGRLTEIYHSGENAGYILGNGDFNQYETTTDSQGVAHIPARIRYLEASQKIERGKPLIGEIHVIDLGNQPNTGNTLASLGSCKIQVDYIAYAWSVSGNVRGLSGTSKTTVDVKPGTRFYPGDLLELGDFQAYKDFDWKNLSLFKPARTKSEIVLTYLDGTTHAVRLSPDINGVPTLIYSFGSISPTILTEARGYIIEWLWQEIQDKGVDVIIKKVVPDKAGPDRLLEIVKLTFFSLPEDTTKTGDLLSGLLLLDQDVSKLFENLYRNHFGANWKKPTVKALYPITIQAGPFVELSTRNNVLRDRTFEGVSGLCSGPGQCVELTAGQEIMVKADGMAPTQYTFEVKQADKWWLAEFPTPANPIDVPLGGVANSGIIEISTPQMLEWFLIAALVLVIGGAIGAIILARQLTALSTAAIVPAQRNGFDGRDDISAATSSKKRGNSRIIYLFTFIAYLTIVLCLLIGGLFLIGGGQNPFRPTPTPTRVPISPENEPAIKAQVSTFVNFINRQDWVAVYNMCAPSYRSLISFEKWRATTVPEGLAASNLSVSKIGLSISYQRAVASLSLPGRDTPWSIPWIKEAGQWYLDCGAQ